MTPPLNFTPAPIYTETFSVIDSCEMPQPVCSAPEPMVIHDEERAMSYVGVGRRCVEEFHRIPNVRLFQRANRPSAPHPRAEASPSQSRRVASNPSVPSRSGGTSSQ